MMMMSVSAAYVVRKRRGNGIDMFFYFIVGSITGERLAHHGRIETDLRPFTD